MRTKDIKKLTLMMFVNKKLTFSVLVPLLPADFEGDGRVTIVNAQELGIVGLILISMD